MRTLLLLAALALSGASASSSSLSKLRDATHSQGRHLLQTTPSVSPTTAIVPTNATNTTTGPATPTPTPTGTGVVPTTLNPTTAGPTTASPTTATSTPTPTTATAAPTTSSPTTVAPTSIATTTSAPTTSALTVGPTTAAPQGLQFRDVANGLNCSEQTRLANVNAMNYLLTLENLEWNFYNQINALGISRTNFTDAGYPAVAYDWFNSIAANEQAHVQNISQEISSSLNGHAVRPCSYNFNVTDVNSYISTARTLSNLSVSAFDGAVNLISDERLQGIIISIATVEARQAAWIQTLQSNSTNSSSTSFNPFSVSMDVSASPSEVVQQISPYFGSCPDGNSIQAPVSASGLETL